MISKQKEPIVSEKPTHIVSPMIFVLSHSLVDKNMERIVRIYFKSIISFIDYELGLSFDMNYLLSKGFPQSTTTLLESTKVVSTQRLIIPSLTPVGP